MWPMQYYAEMTNMTTFSIQPIHEIADSLLLSLKLNDVIRKTTLLSSINNMSLLFSCIYGLMVLMVILYIVASQKITHSHVFNLLCINIAEIRLNMNAFKHKFILLTYIIGIFCARTILKLTIKTDMVTVDDALLIETLNDVELLDNYNITISSSSLLSKYKNEYIKLYPTIYKRVKTVTDQVGNEYFDKSGVYITSSVFQIILANYYCSAHANLASKIPSNIIYHASNFFNRPRFIVYSNDLDVNYKQRLEQL